MGTTFSRTGRCLTGVPFKPALTGAALLLLVERPGSATAGVVGIADGLAGWKSTTSNI